MQRMKKSQGITLISLVVTVIVMLILAGTGTAAVYTGLQEIKDNKLNTELGMVRQAIIQQYSLAEAVGKVKILPEEPKVSFWKGERLENGSSIDIPTNRNAEDENGNEFLVKWANYHPVYQEDFYYRITTEQLGELGVSSNDSDNTYIVNYSTGEVYNETKKMTSESNLLYLPSTVYDNNTQKPEDNRFQDWN